MKGEKCKKIHVGLQVDRDNIDELAKELSDLVDKSAEKFIKSTHAAGDGGIQKLEGYNRQLSETLRLFNELREAEKATMVLTKFEKRLSRIEWILILVWAIVSLILAKV